MELPNKKHASTSRRAVINGAEDSPLARALDRRHRLDQQHKSIQSAAKGESPNRLERSR
jgi:hypothetical protein